MKKLTKTTLVLCILAGTSCSPTAPSKGQVDNPTPQVRIVTPTDGSVIEGRKISVEIETKNFDFAYHKATTPGTMKTLPEKYAMVPQEANSGHVHVYLAGYPRKGEVTPEKFFMIKSFVMPNKADFVLEDVEPGKYRLLVDLAQHDHTSRIKQRPTDWPPFDMITIIVQ